MGVQVLVEELLKGDADLTGFIACLLRIEPFGDHGLPFNRFLARYLNGRFGIAADLHRSLPTIDLVSKQEGLAAETIDLKTKAADLDIGKFYFLASRIGRAWLQAINSALVESKLSFHVKLL